MGETTWSFLHRVAAAYGLEAGALAGSWRWSNPVQRKDSWRPDGEVLLDEAAQEQLAGWCGVPAEYLAQALPSWGAGREALAGRGGDGQGWARWRRGAAEWGPVVFGCSLCAASRGAGRGRVWVYRPRWRRLCVRHGRWLLDVGEGHPLRFVDVAGLTVELGRALRRWGRVARAGAAGGADPGEVFALARAVVCEWWGRKEFWEREQVWGARLEEVVAATRWWGGDADPVGWGAEQWRLLVRDVVVFPEIVGVAGPLVEPDVRQLVAGEGASGLVRGRDVDARLAAVLGERLKRRWLVELEEDGHGALTSWVRAVVREQRRAIGSRPGQGRGLWWVRAVHRPVEVGAGLRLLAGSPGSVTDAGVCGVQGPVGGGGWEVGPVVPRWEGRSGNLQQRRAQQFAEGLEHARRHVREVGHLALAHTGSGVREGFDLGRWVANRRAEAAALTVEQAAQLRELDRWWNPPWPVDWQRAWYRARAFVDQHGPVDGGSNLAGLPTWLERWLRLQISQYGHLREEQRSLLGELGLTAAEVRRFHAWPGRRRAAADGLEVAGAFAARHGHLAVSKPTCVDGFALGAWLNEARCRQRSAGRPTRLGRQLDAIDAGWNPSWPVVWQRTWWAARYHLTGLPKGTVWWPDAPEPEYTAVWLREQLARRPLLQPGQRSLVEQLLPLAGEAPVWQPRISDAAWRAVSALLPPLSHSGGRRRCERQILEAIVHIACTKTTWRRLPQALGSAWTCQQRFGRWREDGTLERICRARLPEPDTRWQRPLAAWLVSAPHGG
ncbi:MULTISPECIES: Helicase associated domain protein [Streptomyces]|uniref:Helicase associated domain protein n=1 Tax=Streptomyces TaxID=1883 RepID=UPI00117F8CDA|nr:MULTISPECIES: Helicase associated domain protein [Streptomyces]